MPLTQDQMDLLRNSFEAACRDTPQVIDLFYLRLFEIAPETRRMFHGDMRAQAEKLRSTLGATLAQIQDLAALRPMLEDLARRHVGYGVVPHHYALVGEALLWTMQRALGPAWDERTAAVWRGAYQFMSGAMILAAYGGESRRAARQAAG